MKRLFFSIISFVSVVLAFAQSNNTKSVYAELLGFEKGLFSNKVTVTVDFGQDVSFWKQGRDNKIVDENGKDIVFNSMVDAMNFMGEKGWSFVQAYVVTHGNQNVYHWLLTKKITEDEEIMEGFKVKSQIKKEEKNKEDEPKKKKYEDDIYK